MLVFTSTSLVPCRPRLLNWGEGGLVHTVCVCASLVPRRPYTHQSDREGEKVNCPNRSNPYHKCDTDYCKSRWSKEGVAMMMSSQQQQQQAGRVRVWECVHVDHCVLFCSPPLYLFLLIGDMWQTTRNHTLCTTIVCSLVTSNSSLILALIHISGTYTAPMKCHGIHLLEVRISIAKRIKPGVPA